MTKLLRLYWERPSEYGENGKTKGWTEIEIKSEKEVSGLLKKYKKKAEKEGYGREILKYQIREITKEETL